MTQTERQVYIAKQINKAIQLTIENTDLSESEMMEVADIYEHWRIGIHYSTGKVVKYGINSDGETQLYKVLQDHISQADWTPDKATSLFKAIGISDDGIPVWTQPYGNMDAYDKGDKVHYPDKDSPVYESLISGNVWSPESYPQGWRLV